MLIPFRLTLKYRFDYVYLVTISSKLMIIGRMILDCNMLWDSSYSACLADNNNIAYLINCANEVY